MRTGRDRLRHALLFEAILFTLTTVLGPLLLDTSVVRVGGLAAALSLFAMSWNYLYNLVFDHALVRMGRPLQPRSIRLRAFHSVLFEMTFLAASVPLVMLFLGYGLLEALAVDVAFALFVPVYAFFFNWAYDVLFPYPATTR